ncbi:MAG: sigma-70 family RNA polymerase sigma factor [Clostridia bacterium]|nr:sigma-70 family RNA polymerase sigma factor [Clostridia bacterium]
MSTLQDDRDRIVELYADTVWCVALSRTGREEAAQEVFQEVFLRYFEKERSYENDEHRKAWLIRTTLICCRRYLSSYYRNIPLPLEEVADLSDEEIDETGALYSALLRLPAKYRIPIVLYYLEELPTEQCLQVLELKPAAFRKRLSRGRELLKKLLKGEDYFV